MALQGDGSLHAALVGWGNFYLITGTAAADLAAALFTVAAVTLLLLCIGIHNAWDVVVHLTLTVMRAGRRGPRATGRPGGDDHAAEGEAAP